MITMEPTLQTQSQPVYQTSQLVLATPWSRLVARLLDSVINFFVSLVLLSPYLLIFLMEVPNFENDEPSPTFIIALITYSCVYIFFAFGFAYYYWIYRPAKHNGQTIGKQWMHIRVVDEFGQVPGQGTFFIRYILESLIAGVISIFVYITILFDDKRRALYDMIVKTMVIEE